MKKSKFLTFCFAMLPGAGHMYQGLMKKGVSIMLAFFAVIAFSVFINLPELCVLLPVLWFYAFFDCMNKSSYTVDELSMLEDKPIFNLKISEDMMSKYASQKNVLAGWAIILIGALILYNSIVRSYIWAIDRYLPGIAQLMQKLPALVISVIVILVGIRLVTGPKNNKAGDDIYEE